VEPTKEGKTANGKERLPLFDWDCRGEREQGRAARGVTVKVKKRRVGK